MLIRSDLLRFGGERRGEGAARDDGHEGAPWYLGRADGVDGVSFHGQATSLPALAGEGRGASLAPPLFLRLADECSKLIEVEVVTL